MSKLLVMPSSKNQIINLMNSVDGFIIGLKDMSVNMPSYFSLYEIKEINELLKKNNKELFVSLNKNMKNNDLQYLSEVMTEFESFNIDGILYYDVSLINIKREKKLKINLVFSEEHAVTNYATINYWNNKGATYAYLSNEITLHEIQEIIDNSNSKIMVCVFGYVPIFVSERKLITNYLKYFDLKSDSKKYYIQKEHKNYRILEDKNTTQVYSDYILNAIEEIPLIKSDYIVFNSFDIEEDAFNYLIQSYKHLKKKDLEKLIKTDKGFLYKETIYKVK